MYQDKSLVFSFYPPAKLFTLNYLPLILRYPIRPINNLINLFIRDRNLPFDLVTFSEMLKEIFLFCEFEDKVRKKSFYMNSI